MHPQRSSRRGRLEVISGSMFSGKSEELIRRVRRAQYARQKTQVFKSGLDNRYGTATINSHSQQEIEAIAVENPADILTHLDPDTIVVAIDEVQFLDDSIIGVCRELVEEHNIRVIVAGLDQDFRGEPFGPMPTLMAQAEQIDKLHAICVKCGNEASRSQRLIEGEPAPYDAPVILVGAAESYEARCRQCHEVPGRPY